MFDGVKKAWEDSQTRLMRNEFETTKAAVDELSGPLKDRVIEILAEAHDTTLRQVGSFENVTLEGRNKLMKAFRSEAIKYKDFDISKSLGLRLFSLWLEGSIRNNQDGRYVVYWVNLYLQAREIWLNNQLKRSKSIAAEAVWDYECFEEWYEVFKKTAGQVNQQLRQDANGGSVIDFMDLEPLRKSYLDKIEPNSLARHFATQYDFSTFGR